MAHISAVSSRSSIVYQAFVGEQAYLLLSTLLKQNIEVSGRVLTPTDPVD